MTERHYPQVESANITAGTRLVDSLRADNDLRLRVIRAEKAAHGAIVALRSYIEAADAWFKAGKASDRDGMAEALDRLLTAHNEALTWAREEAEHVRSRT